MLSPLPRRSGWVVDFARYPSHVSLPRKGCRVGLRIVLFEACSAFTRVTACTLALPPIRGTHSEGFSYFVTSIAAPVASGWSGCRVGLAPTGKRRLRTAHPLADLQQVCFPAASVAPPRSGLLMTCAEVHRVSLSATVERRHGVTSFLKTSLLRVSDRARTDRARRSPRSIRPLRSSRRCSRVSGVDCRNQVP